jgi:hypothetical protein
MADDDEARGLELMREAEAQILDGVDRLAAQWVQAAIEHRIPGADQTVREEARVAGVAARERVTKELRELFAVDPAQQRATPLEIVRTLRYEVTAVLAARDVPTVVRDPFEVRSFADDVYGVVPRSLGDLGDEDLGPLLLAWGLGKSKVLRARATREISSE